jgi:hypothetical protein
LIEKRFCLSLPGALASLPTPLIIPEHFSINIAITKNIISRYVKCNQLLKNKPFEYQLIDMENQETKY